MPKQILGHTLSKSISHNCTAERLVQDISDHFLASNANVALLKTQGKLSDLIDDICSIVELECGKHSKIDKKSCVMQVLLKLYPDFTDSEKMSNSRDIEHFVKHGLKHVGRCRRLARFIKSFFCSLKNGGSGAQSA